MKKAISILMCILFLFTTAYAEDEFLSIQDEAAMISPDVERYVLTQNKHLSEETGARIIFVTDKTTGELSVVEYTQKLYDDLDVASYGRKNCILIFMAEEAQDYHIIISDSISAALPRHEAQKILVNNMEADFEKGNYDKAVVKTYNAFAEWYCEKYNVELELTENMNAYKNIIETEEKERELMKVLMVILLVSVVLGVLYFFARMRRRKRILMLKKRRQERRKKYMQIK